MPNIFIFLQIRAKLDNYTDKGLSADFVLQEILLVRSSAKPCQTKLK
ncbi:MAG: hypothetical protein V7K89_13590 [Nostoc sp.]